MSCLPKEKDYASISEFTDIVAITLVIDLHFRTIASLKKKIVELTETVAELCEKRNNLRSENSADQEPSGTEMDTDLLNENAEMELILETSTEEATNVCINKLQEFALADKLAYNQTLQEALKLANEEKLQLTLELESLRWELSEQLELVEESEGKPNAVTAHSEQLAHSTTSCIRKKEDSESTLEDLEIAVIKVQNGYRKRRIAALEKKNEELKKTLTKLNHKVKNLSSVNSDQEPSSKKIITDLLNENAKVEAFLEELTKQIKHICITEENEEKEMAKRRNEMAEKITENIALRKHLKLTHEKNFELCTELESVRSQLSVQLDNVEELKIQLNALTAHFEQVTKDLTCKNVALKEQEDALNKAIDENKEQKLQLENIELTIETFMGEDEERQAEHLKCKSELEGQRAVNSDLEIQLATAKESVQKTEANLEKVERELEERQLQVQALKKENEELAMKIESFNKSAKHTDV